MIGWAQGLAHAARAVIAGQSAGKPLDHQCAIHLGHVLCGPALLWFLSPALAAGYAAAFGLVKQGADALAGNVADALADAAVIVGLTALACVVYASMPWGDAVTLRAPLWLLSPLWPLGLPMALTLAIHAARSGRRDLRARRRL